MWCDNVNGGITTQGAFDILPSERINFQDVDIKDLKASHKVALKEIKDSSNKVCTKLEEELNQSKKLADKMASDLTDLKNMHDNEIRR